jgi:uroporphyrinogen III methyltransferase / synthase
VSFGRVYLVGAGPGDPGLITVRGAECLRRADVVIYDRLVHPDLLKHARPEAERVYVGKKSAEHTLRQEQINELIVAKAKEGNVVCRLKGGDPFVFGRGGEEAEECLQAGIPFEIVPGVTSAIAAPAYAGIPITHRDAASSFAVITGHERNDHGEAATREAGEAEGRRNWANIARAADTLVFLMGVENIREIADRLMEHGRSPETPVALVRWGTWPRQQTLTSTLSGVAEDVQRVGFTAPAVTVVGEVVRLRDTLRWFDTRPLFGRRVLVTRAREQASALSDLLKEQGAEPVEFPLIRIAPLLDYSELDEAIAALSSCDWVVFTSANAVDAVFGRLENMGRDARAFGNAKIAAIGNATAQTLRNAGLRADFIPSQFVAEAVVEEWPDKNLAGKRVLLPRAKEAREFLPDRLREMGATVDVVPAYENVRDAGAADSIREQLQNGDLDAVTFTSSSTVKNFVESMGPVSLRAVLKSVTTACIGPVTAETARAVGIEPDIVSDESTIAGLVEALAERFAAAKP